MEYNWLQLLQNTDICFIVTEVFILGVGGGGGGVFSVIPWRWTAVTDRHADSSVIDGMKMKFTKW